jgi:hypothetical protein
MEAVRASLTAESLRSVCDELIAQGEDVAGGVNAFRIVRRLLGEPALSDAETGFAYDRLKPAFRQEFDEIPSLVYFEGD